MRTLLVRGLLVGFLTCLAAPGCGGGGGGATPGGVKDLRLARELIGRGLVPPADALLVEAMFAEHDLPVEGPACARTLCLDAAAGFAPELDGAPRGWAQIGLSTAIDLDTFTRPSTTFVFTVDVSGSMGWGFNDAVHPSAGDLSRALLHKLADELRPDDQVAIVTYGSDARTALSLRSGAERTAVHAAIDRLDSEGATDMESGMRRAVKVGEAAVGATAQVRIVLFTDVNPNIGATGAGEFGDIVSRAAKKGVHTTVLALGLGIDPEIMRGMASLRGANAFSLTRTSELDTFMAEEYPWFTTPIAFDLRVSIESGAWSIDRGLGFPAASDAEQLGLTAQTVFLSRRRGALLAALTPPAGATTPDGLTGRLAFRYEEASGEQVTDTAAFAHDGRPVDERGHWYGQRGVARTTALALFTEAMHDAAAVYGADPARAEGIMRAAQERFTADADTLGDDDLPVEVELGAALLELIVRRAPQGNLYGE
ncbi:MAG: VWA domain-containing protein [Deltaproteobacteria bacterium]|nr:VWA domain-containing protein [Deltaproteobacteria bacterium]